ncbi:hypothetical protein CPAR01_12236 [Colletotrichum paranaense]|uniref:Uncharacterized protein n=1 Tax=Colletotrichum paranaense TaxID=1914294 RepID=A0ABQ9S9E4_9PEZI|nr:uncharacterized protein CPAR01_12236 [Colletotrichum paranaense]KAK1529924.1 hypothetical protein CPAR01_12236 [Colletotrichum paranaense]
MCHGHPRLHPCSHTSINWHYCPSALIDLETGVETPCSHLSYATAQPSNADCPLINFPTRATTPDMAFSELRQGAASRRFGYGSSSRSHRRGSALSKINGFPPVDENADTVSPSASGSCSRSNNSYKSSTSGNTSYGSVTSASRSAAYRVDLEYSSKRHKSSSGKSSKKSQKSMRAH